MVRSSVAPAVELRDLVKSFGPPGAVVGIDLTVDHGAVYGVFGPNGGWQDHGH